MFDENIFQAIQRVWEQDQKHPFRDRKQKPVPNITDLRTIIEVSFFASLRREEDHPLTFAIALLPHWEVEQEQQSSGRKQRIMHFSENLPFTVDSISKLSPAFDHKITALIVGPKTKERKDYELWGAMYYSSSPRPFHEVPASVDFLFRPDVLMVTVTSVGSLLLSRANSQLCRFIGGNIIPSAPTPFSSKAMGKHIIETIKNGEGFKKFGTFYWQLFRPAIDYLLSETSLRGHGSTIILLPNDSLETYTTKYICKYRFKETLQIDKLIMKQLSYSDHDPTSCIIILACNKLIAEQLSFLAQLACIDGALLLTSDLHIVAFGSILNTPNWNGRVITGPDGFGGGGNMFEVTTLGTRHNSAINFIGACPGSVGFIISQDRMIRGFVRDDEHTILCWPDCMVSMSV
ncbi:MAG: putative sensor domain DACNV-containing protein [Desulfobaccales bacterium]